MGTLSCGHLINVSIHCMVSLLFLDEEDSPPDHFNSQYTHDALVTNSPSVYEWKQ